MPRRAKIVCTLGPATATPERMRALVDAGMDLGRVNFSHGTPEDHRATCALLRQVAADTGRCVGILADLQGPKIRLGKFARGPVTWATGEEVVITVDDVAGSHDRVSTTYAGLAADVSVGDRLLVDDGRVAMSVINVTGGDVRCLVTEGGPVSDNKGLSLPNIEVSVPALTAKDADDLRLALELDADLIALSFVRSPDDVADVHAVMDEVGRRRPVIAKIEKPAGVDRLEAIIDAFDGIMVARGDLGVELPLEQVPIVQKRAIQICRERAKPVLVATQMLDSMVASSRPTRAEASDVANAVLDGADGLMLSNETSVGVHPDHVVRTMATIIEYAEREGSFHVPPLRDRPRTKGGAIAAASCEVGAIVGAQALVCFTKSGDTARRLAKQHSPLPLLALTPDALVARQLALTWGCETFVAPTPSTTDSMVEIVQDLLLASGRFEVGDQVVIVAGSPPGVQGSTNALRVWRLGDELPRV